MSILEQRPQPSSIVTTEAVARSAPGIKRARTEWIGLALIAPSVIIPLFLMLAFVFGILMTFTHWRLTTGYGGFVGLQNYVELLQDSALWKSVGVVVQFTLINVTVELILGLGLALLLNEHLKALRVWRTLLILPLMTPPVVGSMLWKVLMRPTGAGVFNHFLITLGLAPQGFLGDPNQVVLSLVVIDVWLHTPFVATILLAGLQSLPHEPYEAAYVDGAGPFQVFRYITLPLLTPYFIVVGFFRCIDSLNVFDTIYGTTLGGPGDASRVLTIMALEEGFLWYNLSTGVTVMVLLWVVCMTVGFILFRHIRANQAGP